jgi:L-fuconolactonase
MITPTRRNFLGAAATVAIGAETILEAQSAPVSIIDRHIHLFDKTRPQGAPYSGGRGNKEPSLPARRRSLAEPLGTKGAIAIEASPWIEDNLWVLEVEQNETVMVGMIGNLQPEKPEFKEIPGTIYHKNRLFLGIRYGILTGVQPCKSGFKSGLYRRNETASTGRSASGYSESPPGFD